MRSRSTAHGAHELGVADQLYTRLIGGIQRLCVTFMCYICVCIYVCNTVFFFLNVETRQPAATTLTLSRTLFVSLFVTAKKT